MNNHRRHHHRGASLVEYALLLFSVLIVGAVAIKLLGPHVKTIAAVAERNLTQ